MFKEKDHYQYKYVNKNISFEIYTDRASPLKSFFLSNDLSLNLNLTQSIIVTYLISKYIRRILYSRPNSVFLLFMK
jgi:hypothetical protein